MRELDISLFLQRGVDLQYTYDLLDFLKQELVRVRSRH